MSRLLLVLSSIVVVASVACGPARGSVRHGDYVIEPERHHFPCNDDWHAPLSGVGQRIYYKGRVVTSRATHVAFSPYNPSRLVYTVQFTCTHDGSESGTFYYSGALDQPVQVNPTGMYEPPPGFDSYWSPDDRFVVIRNSTGQSLTLANLRTGNATELRYAFRPKRDGTDWSAHLGGWSPDGSSLALILSWVDIDWDHHRMMSGCDLLAVEPVTLRSSYIATTDDPPQSDCWEHGEFRWVASRGSHAISVDSSRITEPAFR